MQHLAGKVLAAGANVEYIEMISPDGHDAFLTDTAKMNEILKNILVTGI